MLNFQLLEIDLIIAGLVKRWKDFWELEELYKKGLANIIISPTNPSQIIAFVGLWSTGIDDCVELGALWAKYPKQNLGKKVFADCCDNIKSKNLSAFMITAKKSVKKLAKRNDWIKEADSTLAYKIRPSTTPDRDLFYLNEKSQVLIRENFSKFSP